MHMQHRDRELNLGSVATAWRKYRNDTCLPENLGGITVVKLYMP